MIMNVKALGATLLLCLPSLTWAEKPLLVGAFSDQSSAPAIYHDGKKLKGLIPEITEALLSEQDHFDYVFSMAPWVRAQKMVENNRANFFVTYPSSKRQKFAYFLDDPIYVEDFGYLIFRKNHPRAEPLKKVTSFSDLKDFILLSVSGTEWEEDVVPHNIKRHYITKNDSILHVAFRREKGDFFIMGLEQLVHLANESGYGDLYDYHKVDFIEDSLIPFHFGVSKKYDGAQALIKQLNQLQSHESFKINQSKILQSYR